MALEQLDRFGLRDYIADIEKKHSNANWTEVEIQEFCETIRDHSDGTFCISTYPLIDWHEPELKENPQSFEEFFGPKGSLVYYPLALVVVRGFSAKFTSSQDWSYDYNHSFSASAGGGFGIGPIQFGASGSYNEHQHEHKIDQQHTSLTIGDDKDTIRFVGYILAKNTVFIDTIGKFAKTSKVGE